MGDDEVNVESASPVFLRSFCAVVPMDHSGVAVPLVSPIDLGTYANLLETPHEVIDAMIAGAHGAYSANRRATPLQRSQWLNAAADAVEACVGDIVSLLIHDIGKPRRLATAETKRSIEFLRGCAAEALRVGGESLPLDAVAAGAERVGFTRRVPYGVVAGITPFNAPINLLLQKVAPALAAGNAIVVKPHPMGTRVALRVAQAFNDAGLPAGLFSVVTGDRDAARALVADLRIAAVSFTGSTAGGDGLVRAAGAKKFVAELGSNSANVVLADADIGDAARRIAAAAFEGSRDRNVARAQW